MNDKNRRPADAPQSQRSPKLAEVAKSADPKQVDQTGNLQQNTNNRRHQQKREER